VPEEVTLLFDLPHEGGGFVEYRGTPDRFPELYSGNGTQLTHLNAHVKTDKWKLPTVNHDTCKAPDGSEAGGVVELPHGAQRGTKLPLIVGIHGGPTTSVKGNLEFNLYDGRLVFAAKGYAVLCPNYRGSTGYGDKFVKDLIGNENDLDVKD